MKTNPLIIALDTSSTLKALNWVHRLKVTGAAFKIGFELFTSGGLKIVERIVNHDVRVFLDLKYHDIPNTVGRASEVATKAGVWMFNVHAAGGSEMMGRAKNVSLEVASKLKTRPPLVTAVTVLTSMLNLSEIGVGRSVDEQVVSLAKLAKHCGLDGVVASAHEAPLIREQNDNFCIVTPGIRLPDAPSHDQKRVASPKEALEKGSDYLVMGRPILDSLRPLKVIETILESLN